MENWKESLKNETFADDAINHHRDEIVSRAVKLPDDDAIKRYVSDMFARKVQFVRNECGEPDFDGQEFMHTEQRWFDGVKVMLAEPHLIDVSKHAMLYVRSELGDYVCEPMRFDGNGHAETRNFGFELADAIKNDLADFEKMNDGKDPKDRLYIDKVWFAGLRVEGPFARIIYTVRNDGRFASSKIRRLRRPSEKRVWVLDDLWGYELKTTVAW